MRPTNSASRTSEPEVSFVLVGTRNCGSEISMEIRPPEVPLVEAAEPVAYVDRAWGADEWSRGCYGGFLTPGAWTDYGRAIREPIGPIHWAGAETAVVWNGYMDGAVSSGERAAAELLAALD
jgi:hypothetical protein